MCHIKQKEIINISDGKRFGFLSDIDIDEKIGRIKKIIVPGSGKIFGVFGRETEYFIPWSDIKQIGDDIILVDVNTDEITPGESH
jgi:YlmC/YmxH family sporulation protein